MLTCLLVFSGFLHIDELLSIKIKHPKINESYLEILLPKSKTDQDRQGHIVYISRVSLGCYIPDITANPEKYGLHSLRDGGASAAGNNGVTDRLVSKQGRWSSEKARNGSIKDSVSTRLSVSRMLRI